MFGGAVLERSKIFRCFRKGAVPPSLVNVLNRASIFMLAWLCVGDWKPPTFYPCPESDRNTRCNMRA
jgi:hypothetical protein